MIISVKDKDNLINLGTFLLGSFIRSQNKNGSIGDGDANLLTHHFLIVLNNWYDKYFENSQNNAIDWFMALPDNYPNSRDAKENDFDPFKLIAFKMINVKKCKNYIKNKYKVFLEKHIRAAGYAVLDLGFSTLSVKF